MIVGLVFILGLIIGSFLNVCIHRLPKNESVVLPGSHCPKCNAGIAWFDNVPVISYLLLGGKCRACKARISPRYAIVELLTAFLLAALFVNFGLTPKLFSYSLLVCGLIVATFVDFEIQAIPDHVTVIGAGVALVLAFLFPSIMGQVSRLQGLIRSVLGACAGGLSVFALAFFGKMAFKREAMGEGDIYLLAMIGAFLGWKLALLTFFMAPIFGIIPGLIAKFRDQESEIAYGPYLSLAALVSVFLGEKILGFLFFGV